MNLPKSIVLFVLLALPTIAAASFDRGERAFLAWDMETAAKEYAQVAATDARASLALARLYRRGYFGKPQVALEKYVEYLELGVRAGDAESKAELGQALARTDFAVAGRLLKPTAEAAARGIVLLREACAGNSIAGCMNLARFVSQGLQVDGFSLVPNQAEAKEIGTRWRRLVFESREPDLRGQCATIHMNGHWGGIDPVDRYTCFIVGLRADGDDSSSLARYAETGMWDGPRPAIKLAAGELQEALRRADALERGRGLAGGNVPASAVSARQVAGFFARRDVPDASELRALSRALAASVLVSNRTSSRLKKDGWDMLLDDLSSKVFALISTHQGKRNTLLVQARLDVATWLPKKMVDTMQPAEIGFLQRFLVSDPGKKFAQLDQSAGRIGAMGGVIAMQLRGDPRMERYDSSADERYLAYAKAHDIRPFPDQDSMAERDREQFFVEYGAQISGERSLSGQLRSSMNLRLAGKDYERLERMLSPREMPIVRSVVLRQGNTNWRLVDGLLAELHALRSKDPALVSLDKELLEQLSDLSSSVGQ